MDGWIQCIDSKGVLSLMTKRQNFNFNRLEVDLFYSFLTERYSSNQTERYRQRVNERKGENELI
jgi:hypothetical protein